MMNQQVPDSRGTCIRIDLGAIAHNARQLKKAMGPGVAVMAVVKANAYGHGLIPVARTALHNGADALGVAVPEEGRALRQAGITAPILVLGNATPEGAMISCVEGLIQTAFDARGIALLQDACRKTGKIAQVHLKIDTGMNRIGARTEDEVRAVLAALDNAPYVKLTGAFTHFADADNPDDSFSKAQFERFRRLAALLPEGLTLHAAASDASLRFPWARLSMVREGIALYGCAEGYDALELKPAMRFETKIAYVKSIVEGDTVGYGRTYAAPSSIRVATLPVGYGDGYPRACSNKGYVLIRGAECPIVGRVCMDQLMADVSRIPDLQTGDTAVLMGKQGNAAISAGRLAGWAGTISYEVLCAPHARVPVIYENIPEGI